jgi:hypothetical protein
MPTATATPTPTPNTTPERLGRPPPAQVKRFVITPLTPFVSEPKAVAADETTTTTATATAPAPVEELWSGLDDVCELGTSFGRREDPDMDDNDDASLIWTAAAEHANDGLEGFGEVADLEETLRKMFPAGMTRSSSTASCPCVNAACMCETLDECACDKSIGCNGDGW